jgi:hypothetical protein
VLVSDAALPAYHFRNGDFPDGAQTALHLSDLGILMVTTYEDGTPVFHVFKEDGEEITAYEGHLSAGPARCQNPRSRRGTPAAPFEIGRHQAEPQAAIL